MQTHCNGPCRRTNLLVEGPDIHANGTQLFQGRSILVASIRLALSEKGARMNNSSLVHEQMILSKNRASISPEYDPEYDDDDDEADDDDDEGPSRSHLGRWLSPSDFGSPAWWVRN